MLALVGYNTSMISSFSLDPTGPLFGSASFPQSQYTPKISHLALLKNVYLLLNIEERSSTLRMIGKESNVCVPFRGVREENVAKAFFCVV